MKRQGGSASTVWNAPSLNGNGSLCPLPFCTVATALIRVPQQGVTQVAARSSLDIRAAPVGRDRPLVCVRDALSRAPTRKVLPRNQSESWCLDPSQISRYRQRYRDI